METIETIWDGDGPGSERRAQVRWTGGSWLEGPAWVPAWGSLLFSDIPASRIVRLDDATGHSADWRACDGFPNGRTVLPDGRVAQCEHGTRAVRVYEHDGTSRLLAQRYGDGRLNSPNDLTWHPDGGIWFTDPTYGIQSVLEGHRAEPEQDGSHLYRIAPDGTLTAVVTDFGQPNGLAFSTDFETLYVADSDRNHLRRFRVVDGSSLSGGEVIAECSQGWFDGLRVDETGDIWISSGESVRVLTPDGAQKASWSLPRNVSNLEFGGERGNTLFVTATDTLYSLRVGVRGARWAGRPS